MAGSVNKVILVGAEHGIIGRQIATRLTFGRVPVS